MSARKPDYAAYVAALEPVLGVTIEDSWRANVVASVGMAATAASLFVDLPFDDAHDEQAGVFRPELQK
jgi:Protein of unknown function (DUF4089)